VQDVEALDKEA